MSGGDDGTRTRGLCRDSGSEQNGLSEEPQKVAPGRVLKRVFTRVDFFRVARQLEEHTNSFVPGSHFNEKPTIHPSGRAQSAYGRAGIFRTSAVQLFSSYPKGPSDTTAFETVLATPSAQISKN